MPAKTDHDEPSFGLCSTSDVITFDQNGHHLYSTSAGGKDLSNDTQIRVICWVEQRALTSCINHYLSNLKLTIE